METLTIKFNTRSSKGKQLAGLIKEMEKDGSVEIQKNETFREVKKTGKARPIGELHSSSEPNAETKRAILDVKAGKVTRCSSVEDMMNKLNA